MSKPPFITIRLYEGQCAAIFPKNGAQPALHLAELDQNEDVTPGMINTMRVAALFADTPEATAMREMVDKAVAALNEAVPSGIILPN